MKVGFHTLGCKVNSYETNAMEKQFIEKGYEIVPFDSLADIYVVNTCSVTNIAEKKSRQMIRKAKSQNNEAMIIVCGCYVQVGKDELEKLEEIDLILGTNEKNDIMKYVEEYLNEKEKYHNNVFSQCTDVMDQKEFIDVGSVDVTNKTRAVIKVQEGCNMFCSYCIIPYARGRIRSRKIQSVITEVESIAKKGIKEIIITGIHLASYGKDFDEELKEDENNNKIRLIDLLEALNKVKGINRIRLSSIEPTIIDNEFMQRLVKLDKICDHFHLSLQSGCNETLKRMNRKYTIERFEESARLIRKHYPNAALTTDIIVGFPGETDEEFEMTYKFLEKIKFFMLHVFKYSPRKGTAASNMKNQIDGNIKEQRSHKLIELSDKVQLGYLNEYIGEKLEILFEEKDEKYMKGHTTNYIIVKVETKDNIYQGKIKNVKITKIDKENMELIGELLT